MTCRRRWESSPRHLMLLWGNLTKGILDFGIAALTALTYLYFNDNKIDLLLFDISVEIPLWLYAILII